MYVPPGSWAHSGGRAFWLGAVSKGGHLSEGQRGIGSVGDVVGEGGMVLVCPGVGLWCLFVVLVCLGTLHLMVLHWLGTLVLVSCWSRVGLVLVSCWVVLVLSMRTLHLRLSAYVALIRKAMWQAQRMLDDAPPWCASSLPPRTRMRVRAVWAYRAYRARTEMEHHWARK